MITFQKDPSARLLKSYLPPFKGTWKTLPAYLLPEDALQDSLNITVLGGLVRSRCGLQMYARQTLPNKVLGSFLTIDTTSTKYPIISTKNKVYQLMLSTIGTEHNHVWKDITSTVTLNGTDNTQVRMTSLQLGTQVYILYANGIDRLKIIPQSSYLLSEITPFTGSIPVCTDVCTSFSRFVGITPPYTVQWCDAVNDSYISFTNWPSLSQAILADTEDPLVAIRPLGTLGIAAYKEGNIFVGFAQSGPNSQAFRFEHRGEYEGPAGVNALVNVNGLHMYMTPTGRIGVFDGTQHAWIADGIWPFLQEDVDIAYAYRIFGVYNYKTAEVTFWYPAVGDGGELFGMLTIALPYPLAGIQQHSYFPGRSNFACTNGLSVRLFNAATSPLIFGKENQTFQQEKSHYADHDFAFPCSFSPGLFRPQASENAGDVYRPILEVYTSRGDDRGTVNVSALTSQSLENNGVATESEALDLTRKLVNEFVGFNDTGSFLGVQFAWDSTSKFEYKGCDVYGRVTV